MKPDELGQRLEHYAEVLPTLNGLRLCHRFGQGQDAHVTRLPVELELAIEAIIIQDKQSPLQHGWEKWADKFRHYEGRCAPIDHVEDIASPLVDQLSDMHTLCKKCEDNIDVELCDLRCQPGDLSPCYTCSQKLDPDNCMESCREKESAAMNEFILRWDWDPMCEQQMEWEEAIDQTGAFARYDTVGNTDSQREKCAANITCRSWKSNSASRHFLRRAAFPARTSTYGPATETTNTMKRSNFALPSATSPCLRLWLLRRLPLQALLSTRVVTPVISAASRSLSLVNHRLL